MTAHALRAEIFVQAFRTLPKQEKKLIIEEIVSDMEPSFSREEIDYLQKLAKQKGLVFHNAKDAIKHLNSL